MAIHWGTWRMALDRIAEPPELLALARKEMGVSEEQFGVPVMGETKAFDA
jgi:N-acyl-phosphatidylethanolamine-hydrolysing phospholipase D